MRKSLQEAVEYCRQNLGSEVVLAIPFPIIPNEVAELRKIDIIKGLVLYHPSPEITANSSCEWLGCFMADGNWVLPNAKGQLVFVGSHLNIAWRMAKQAHKSGRHDIVCKINGSYQPIKLYRFFLWRAGEKLHRQISQLPHDSIFRNILYGVARIPLVKNIWKRVFKRGGASQQGHTGDSGEHLYLELFRTALAQPDEKKIKPVPRRVLLVNAGLAAGGAERQIVNTLIGLRDSGQCESVALLAEYIDHAPDLKFFSHELEGQGIEVAQVQRTITLAEEGLSSLHHSIAELAAELPASILEEVVNLVEEFRNRCPSVVHAWQDSTSIKAGIAAVIAGVPHIVLASRNVAPKNFTYYQEYMYYAYKALASLECVTFLNNSEAGAAEYIQWLGLPRERFAIVRNGVDLGYLKRADNKVVREYRQSLGIPADAMVVGSIFRFWAEKRPMLWLQTAALVAKCFPEVHFLIIGEGPMRQEMEFYIQKSGLMGRVHLPGARPEVATPLSAMNVFLLTSEFEGTPNVVLEAQWLGLPIVATDAGGTRESFDQNVTGLLAINPAPEEIASLLFEYLGDKQKIAQAGLHGAQFVARAFGIQQMVQATIELYELNKNERHQHSDTVVQSNSTGLQSAI